MCFHIRAEALVHGSNSETQGNMACLHVHQHGLKFGLALAWHASCSERDAHFSRYSDIH